jgi:aldehyde:ferredoxin oxidoreductase
MYGWAGQRLKVYLTEGKIVKEPLSEDLRLEYLGSRGFNSKTLFDEVKPGIDPLSPENVFIVGIGPLAGTIAPGASRWTVTAKSPQTDIFTDGNGGGDFGAELRFAGYEQIIVYGRSPKPVYLWINNDHVELRDASRLWGKTTWDTHNLLVEELGDREIRELSIGPAGENQVRIAKLYANTTRAGGKGGIGAVMGSKNLKAVVVRGTGSVKIANPEELHKATKHCYEKLETSPFHRGLRDKGTYMFFDNVHQKRSLATRNSQAGYIEGWGKLTWGAFESQYAVKHTGCFACPLSCCQYYQVKEGPYTTHGCASQYGTIYPFASRIGSVNLAAALMLTTMCDRLGLDTHSCGATISFAMEAWQRGLLTAEDTDGLDLSWGNIDVVIQLVRKIAYREGFGNILAEGSWRASKQIKGSGVCLNTAKGLECSSYFPGEGAPRIKALGYATAPVGGSIHRGYGGWGGAIRSHPKVRNALSEEVFKRLGDPHSYEGQGVVLAVENDYIAALGSLGLCLFFGGGGGTGLDHNDIAWLFSATTGFEMDGDGLLKVGERIFTVERAFNIREGMCRKDDTLPERFFVEKVTPFGRTGLNKAKFQAMLDEYYTFRGWDEEGVPTKEKLDELNLDYIAEQIGAV